MKVTVAEISNAEGNKFYLQVAYSSSHDSALSEEQLSEVRSRLEDARGGMLETGANMVVQGEEPTPAAQMFTVSGDGGVTVEGTDTEYIRTLTIDPAGASLQELAATRLIIKDAASGDTYVDVPVPYIACAYWSLDDYASAYTAVAEGKLVLRFPIPIGAGLEFSIAALGSEMSRPI